MKHARLLIAVLALVFALAVIAVQLAANNAAQSSAQNAVSSCERGNDIRDYLAFDNDERIKRLEQQLAAPALITQPDLQAFRTELERRYGQRERLQPYPCESLR